MAVNPTSKPRYRAYTLHNFRQIPGVQRLGEEARTAIEVVGRVLPFKTNNYVIEQLIDWDKVPDDPIFVLTFPQKEMLKPWHFETMAAALHQGVPNERLRAIANSIQMELNPHPAGQMELNVPEMGGIRLTGIQHKYRETILFFPRHGQTCHAYCSFCFRWPQFVGIDELRFAMRDTDLLIAYLQRHPEVTDVLFTGGDPLIMKTEILAIYMNALLEANLPNLTTIRIGTKALSYWPFRFVTEADADSLLDLFSKVVQRGKHLAIMAHFNHIRELSTEAVRSAIARIRDTGAEIRTQSPVLAHINDSFEVWAEMWREQVRLGCIPYYMFVVRDTGAQHYFGVPLVQAWWIFKKAYQLVSGLARTVRGPSMSATPGKIQILGINKIYGQRVLALQFLQAREPEWVLQPFFAKYDEHALWIDELKPAFGQARFFFEEPVVDARLYRSR